MLSLDENQIYLYTSSLSGILDIRSNQTFILFTYGENDKRRIKKRIRKAERF
jgi:methylase of polypeptide subunit release factors